MTDKRWDAFFSDLEGELAAAESADLRLEVADRTRREFGSLRLVDRLRPALGHPVHFTLSGGHTVAGILSEVGSDWVLIGETTGSALVPLAQVRLIGGLGAHSSAPGSEGHVAAALDLRHALRGLARNRAEVVLTTVDGDRVSGTLDRIGADFAEIAQHQPGEPRRRSAVQQVLTVPIRAIGVVRAG
ncbi:MAG: hypothetical protein WCB04_15145 [Mycobacteriales bacterium]